MVRKQLRSPEWKGIYNLPAVLHQVFLKGQSLAHCFTDIATLANNSVDSAAIEGNCITLSMLMTCYCMKLIIDPQHFICACILANNVGRWVTASNLRLNSAKCKTMIVTRCRTRAVLIPNFEIVWSKLRKSLRIQI